MQVEGLRVISEMQCDELLMMMDPSVKDLVTTMMMIMMKTDVDVENGVEGWKVGWALR